MSEPEKPAAAPSAPSLAPTSALQRDTDRVARPGFRNPPNKGSKAQKSSGSKNKKK